MSEKRFTLRLSDLELTLIEDVLVFARETFETEDLASGKLFVETIDHLFTQTQLARVQAEPTNEAMPEWVLRTPSSRIH